MKSFSTLSKTAPASISALLLVFAADVHATPTVATQFDFSSETNPGARKFYFETLPAHRYKLWRSTDLNNWSLVPGYPQTAAGLSIEHTFTQDVKEFFRVEPLDDQPPAVVAQYPSVEGFAVGRFADVSVELSDASSIDPASIRLTVGEIGPLAPGAAGLTASGNTITYDSGDQALGAWGATISATVVAADILGHTLTYTWSFRLEPEPQVAVNIFVFGSPTAQRAGQRVSGPSAALASRFQAPVGPTKANDPPPWYIEEVLADSIVIAYEVGGVPSFSADQLICNLTPTNEKEIFYRRVISMSNDTAGRKLTVMTEDVALTDFASSGAAAVSGNSVAFDLDASGTFTSSKAISGTLYFSEIGLNLSGSRFKLLEHGYETTVAGITYKSGNGETLVDIDADELFWKIKPQFRAGVEIDSTVFPPSTYIRSCEAVVTGRASYSTVFRAKGLLRGAFSEEPIISVPLAKVVYVGAIGIVPVYTSLKFGFSVKTKASVQALIDSHMTYRQEAQASFGLEYHKTTGIDWVNSFQASVPEMAGDAALAGEFSLKVTIDPKVSIVVYGTAGFQASLEPSGKITTTVSATTGPDPVFGGELEASLDFVIKPTGLLFDLVYPNGNPELSLNIWKSEWPLLAHTLAFKTQPLSRTVAPGDNVIFTCSVDSPSPPTFQWYQNGRALPSQTSRSLFLDRVTSGFSGNYFVRVKAGNRSMDSEIATLAVQTVTPQTIDTDRDGVPDIYETNTGVWGSATDRGTNPYKWDSDGDGLSDKVETKSGVFSSSSDTGTDPNRLDSDGDGDSDGKEVQQRSDPNLLPTPTGFAYIPAGEFQMGDALDKDSISPIKVVYVNAFYMQTTEVNKAQWDDTYGFALSNGYNFSTAGSGKAPNHPAYGMSWYDMVKWCNACSQKHNLEPCYFSSGLVYKMGQDDNVSCDFAKTGFRLPTEAEWEKAARGGGIGKRFPWGDTIMHSQCNYWGYATADLLSIFQELYDISPTRGFNPMFEIGLKPYTSPVGSFAPNALGIYDASGNVGEACWDKLFQNSRALRGGSWGSSAGQSRVGIHRYQSPSGSYGFGSSSDGFRLARTKL